MTTTDAQALKPGDIVEFRGEGCYWLGKLSKLKTDPHTGAKYWEAKNRGVSGGESFGIMLPVHPNLFHLVGHSDYP